MGNKLGFVVICCQIVSKAGANDIPDKQNMERIHEPVFYE
jgi:hypothetical protein